jgi:hypothetical protein
MSVAAKKALVIFMHVTPIWWPIPAIRLFRSVALSLLALHRASRLILFVIACERVHGRWPECSRYCRRDKTESAGDQDERHHAHRYAPTGR